MLGKTLSANMKAHRTPNKSIKGSRYVSITSNNFLFLNVLVKNVMQTLIAFYIMVVTIIKNIAFNPKTSHSLFLTIYPYQYAKKCLHGLDFESIMGWIVSQISKVDARVDKHASMFNLTLKNGQPLK